MESCKIPEAADRIKKMEQCFDELQNVLQDNPFAFRKNAALKGLLRNLTWYYESGQWLQDYALDEQGCLPETLKRGVLSQDAVYDFLEQIRRLDSDDT